MNSLILESSRAPNGSAPQLPLRHPVMAASAILLAAVLLYLAELVFLSNYNGLWLDEIFSLWFSNPSGGLRDTFVHKIITDSNPPLYYSALYGIRRLVADNGAAIILLNVLAVAGGALAVALTSWRAGILATGLVGIAAVLLTGPILRYSLEARSYLIALQIIFVASWYCSVAVQCRRRPTAAAFTVLGCLAALTHVYAALMVGSLAAGLVTLATFDKRRDLWAPGLALGLAAVVTTGLWVLFGLDLARIPHWIRFDLPSITRTIVSVIRCGLGGADPWLESINFLLLAALFVAGFFSRSTRALAVAFSVALALFILIPIGVSFEQPMISAAYWTIGLPTITVFSIFLCRTWYSEARSVQRRYPIEVRSLVATFFVVLTDLEGFAGARLVLGEKMIWSGAPIVARLARNCPPASVHIFQPLDWLYAQASGLPADTFIDAQAPQASALTADKAKCRVLGWAEHYVPMAGLPDIADQELLALLTIDASPMEAEVVRHRGGFVVLRRE